MYVCDNHSAVLGPCAKLNCSALTLIDCHKWQVCHFGKAFASPCKSLPVGTHYTEPLQPSTESHVNSSNSRGTQKNSSTEKTIMTQHPSTLLSELVMFLKVGVSGILVCVR